MKQATQYSVNLFADELPTTAEIKQLAEFVNSSESNQIAFSEQVESNISKTSPKNALATGIGLFILFRFQEAVEKLNKATDCQQKYFFLAFALRRMRSFEDAIENLQEALKYNADPLTVTLEKAATYRSAFDFEAAAQELKSCKNYANINAEYHYQLGRLLEDTGEYKEAMDNYKTAIELSPNHRQSLFRLAYRCDLSGDEQAAIDYYKQIAAVNPVYINALINLAVLYDDNEEYDKASFYLDKVLKYHPNNQRAILFKKDVESSKTMYYDEEIEERLTRETQILQTPISDFELSVRSRNCLRKMNIYTLGDLLNISETELLSYKNFGETSLREIKAILEAKSLTLGMALEEKLNASFGESDFEQEEFDEVILSKPLSELPLSVRARNCLAKLDLSNIGELIQKTDAELLGCKNFGVTSLNEIKQSLEKFDLSLRSID